MLNARSCALVAGSLLLAALAPAQEAYRQPPPPIPQILDAQPLPMVLVSPDRTLMLVANQLAHPPISELAAPELRLAGHRIDPRNWGRARDSAFTSLEMQGVAGGAPRAVTLPAGARVEDPRWSSDSRRIAFSVVDDDGISLWVADAATSQARALTGPQLNSSFGPPCTWVAGGQELLCRMRPEKVGAAPPAEAVPSGPVTQETKGRAAPNPTYQDLLDSPRDEALFEHYFTSQVARVGLDGRVTRLGAAGVIESAQASPDGRYLLVRTVHRPFSYMVPSGRFPVRTEVWGREGKLVRLLSDRGLQEDVAPARDAVPTGMRQPAWRADAEATVAWIEALDEGNPARPAAKRDRLYALAAPFEGEPMALLDVEYRIDGLRWGRGDLALVDEGWWKNRRARTWVLNPSQPGSARMLFDRSSEDRYSNPGEFATFVGPRGTPILLTTPDGQQAYLIGQGASAEGDQPFVDRIDLVSGRKERLWRSAAPAYEEVVAVLDQTGARVLTRKESVLDAPNYFVRDLPGGTARQVTRFADPAPALAGVTSELIRYKRADGVELSAKLYLPAGYVSAKGPLPFLFWAYPREFKSSAAAAQVSGSPYRFTRPGGPSHLLVLTQGYGVLDNPTMPIVGEGNAEPNDTYIQQLVANARAAVDAVVARGVADRDRIAVGGHSYGAFMTANLLAHSDLFRAGIARSGAYNRTLTPFGFQAEDRTFWEARDTYMAMSPFGFADKVNEPILLIHGQADNNTGTFPIQSERFFAALKGHGATARLVLLPAEAHGYRARESVGHTLWEMVSWLDRYVKDATPRDQITN